MDLINRFRLDGRTALVTGASRGIGRAIAESLAAAGADVAVIGRDGRALTATAGAIAALGRRAAVCVADLADPASPAAAVAQAERELGTIDLLVHAAGATVRTPSAELTRDDYERIMQINAASAVQLAQAVGSRLASAGRAGSMVFICSLMSDRARPTVLAYTMSKTALVGLVRTLAVEWGPVGIRANGIAPGYIRTELTRPLQLDPVFNQWVLDRTPAKRWGEPGDIAPAAVFLSSPAGEFVNGQVLYVDGGWTAGL